MGWERRERGGLYYVRKVREGDTVRSEYVGCGETALLIARLEAFDRQDAETEREGERLRRAEWKAREAQNEAFFEQVEVVLRQALAAAGYHRHNRGEWRKRRERGTAGQPGQARRGGGGTGEADEEGGSGQPGRL